MAKIALNKSALQKERERLRLYQRLLPSLDLKRRQLTMEANRARELLARDQAEVQRLSARVAEQLPMLANQEIAVSGLVKMESVQLDRENVVGLKLPVLAEVRCTVQPYSLLAKPHWVDVLVEYLQQMATLQAQVQIAAERVRLLDRAVRRTTQRVNLFDKILIPTTRKNIQRIQIYLGDAERTAIVRSKLAKAKGQSQQQSMAEEGRAL
jgi:V/A-type H+-transporting ATPase subunit D